MIKYLLRINTTSDAVEETFSGFKRFIRRKGLHIRGASFLILTLVLGIRVMIRYRQERSLQEFGIAGKVYREMRNILNQVGFRGLPTQTPHEYLSGLKGEMVSELAIIQSLQQVTEIYTQVRFGGFKLSEDSVRDLRRMWKQNKWTWISFSLKHRIVSFRRRLVPSS